MSSENTNQEEESAASPTEEDLDSDVGTIFSTYSLFKTVEKLKVCKQRNL